MTAPDISKLNPNTQSALASTGAATQRNFGVDTSCTTGLRSGVLVSSVLLVAQAAFRRLSTPRGSLYGGEDEQDYGLDLVGILGSAAGPNQSASMPGQIQAELMKDPRISAVTASIVEVVNGPVVSWMITVQAETADGPFSLVLAVSDMTVQLIGIAAGVTG